MSGIEDIASPNSLDVLVIKNLGRGGWDIDTAKFKGKQNIRKLHLYWSSLDDDDNIALHDDYVTVLEGLQPQPNLKVLGIHDFSGLKLPRGSLSYYLPNLVELHIENCQRCTQLPALGMLNCLRVLNISGMKSVKRLGKEFYYQEETCSRISLFRTLTELSLSDMPILEEWLAPPSPHRSFPSLKRLIVSGCSGLKSIPLSSCYSLVCLKLRSITDEAVNSILDSNGGGGLYCLTSVSIQDSPQLIFFPVAVIQKNTRIQSLEIADCSEFQGFRIINNNYDKTKLSLGTVFNNSSISTLRSLKLSDCPALSSLPDLQKWTSLTELRIENCDKLKKSFPYDLASLHNLRTLYVDRFIDVSNKLGTDTDDGSTTRIQSVMHLIMPLIVKLFIPLIVLGIVNGLLIFGPMSGGAPRTYHWESLACTLICMCAILIFAKQHGYGFIGILLEVLKLVDSYRKSKHPKDTRRSWNIQENQTDSDFDLSGPSHLTNVNWEDKGYRRSVMASLVKGVYVLQDDHRRLRKGTESFAPPWWESFGFKLVHNIMDDGYCCIFGAVYEYDPKPNNNYYDPIPNNYHDRPTRFQNLDMLIIVTTFYLNILYLLGLVSCYFKSSFRRLKGYLSSETKFLIRPPKYVIAFRGNSEAEYSLRGYMGCDTELLNTREKAMHAVSTMVSEKGADNIWLAGHSQGATVAMHAGRTMAKEGIFLESYLYNPLLIVAPEVSIEIGIVERMRQQSEDLLTTVSPWIPNMFLHRADTVCSGFISYFEEREMVKGSGLKYFLRLATRNWRQRLLMNRSELEDWSEELYLIPSSACVTTSCTPGPAHNLSQWFTDYSVSHPKVYRYSGIFESWLKKKKERHLRSLDPCNKRGAARVPRTEVKGRSPKLHTTRKTGLSSRSSLIGQAHFESL